jgi:hypothetical protein
MIKASKAKYVISTIELKSCRHVHAHIQNHTPCPYPIPALYTTNAFIAPFPLTPFHYSLLHFPDPRYVFPFVPNAAKKSVCIMCHTRP